MSLVIPQRWDRFRVGHWSNVDDLGDRHNGCLKIPARMMTVVISSGEGWEHASVSHPDHCPTWEEMCWVKESLWEDDDTVVMQLHVPKSDHKNFHPYCLHLWRPLPPIAIPRPPSIFVAT